VLSSQGSTVSFGGVLLGGLRSFRVIPGSAVYESYVHVGSTVVGTGVGSRVVRENDCVAIEPGGVDVSFWGRAPWVDDDVGKIAVLTVTYSNGFSRSWEASLETFDDGGQTGERVVGTARFKRTGRAL
jgi:hypothetical protein